MKLPKSIRISGLKWTLKLVGDENLPNDRSADCDRDTLVIRISDKLVEDATTQVLLHEIRHALNFEDSEQECEQWSHDICQILFDNPLIAERFRRRNGTAKPK